MIFWNKNRRFKIENICRAVSLIGLALIAFGGGGVKPCVSAFGGDQFKIPEQEKLIQVILFLEGEGSRGVRVG